jgi:hypothetical protein
MPLCNPRSTQLKNARNGHQTAATADPEPVPRKRGRRGGPDLSAQALPSTALKRAHNTLEDARNLSHAKQTNLTRKKQKIEVLEQELSLAKSVSTSHEDTCTLLARQYSELQSRHNYVLNSISTSGLQ